MTTKNFLFGTSATGLFCLVAGVIWADAFIISLGVIIISLSFAGLKKDCGQRRFKKYLKTKK